MPAPLWRHAGARNGLAPLWPRSDRSLSHGALRITQLLLVGALCLLHALIVAPPALAAPGDENWDDRFYVRGLNGNVNTIVRAPNGDLYAGGSFTTADGATVNRIARWDGTSWSGLGGGVDSTGPYSYPTVYAIAFDASGNVYVGGSFATAGGAAAGNIAMWNGASWSTLGSGTNSTVYALAFDSAGNLYAGGGFTTAGGTTVNAIARWDGSAWSGLNGGVNQYRSVRSLVFDSAGNLYAGGYFETMGGVSAMNIALWNGSSWAALGNGTSGSINTLALDSAGNLYAGGTFTGAGNVGANHIARWDGSVWSAVGGGIPGSVNYVHAIAFDSNGDIYVGGNFNTQAGAMANFLARWNGSGWSALSSTVNDYVYALAFDGSGNLYVGGNLTTAGTIAATGIARWSAGSWSDLSDGVGAGLFYPRVHTMAGDGNGTIYAGGTFATAGGAATSTIARWDGSAWAPLGSGTTGTVQAMAVAPNGNLYAGGSFRTAGGVTAMYVGRWDGSTWAPLGSGMPLGSNVSAMAVAPNGDLYVGGTFTSAGGVAVSNIARWNGSSWAALGSGVNNRVNALAVDAGGTLYAGGMFTSAGGVSASRIARWDGSAWAALGSGVSGSSVNALAVDGSGNLYVGGQFTGAGSVYSSYNIARWDGSAWAGLGSGMDYSGSVNALAIDGSGTLYAGGQLTSAGGAAASKIARWNGSSWAALGSGLNADGYVNALVFDGGAIYAGGYFATAGGKPSSGFARWSPPTAVASALSLAAASGSYGGSATLQATLTAGGAPLAGRSVSFTINGDPAGSATTDAGGVATLSAGLGAIGAGSYPGAVGASFAGEGGYTASSAGADLTVSKAAATISLSSPTFTYDGSAKTATATTSPAGLGGVSITYDGGAAAPVDAGVYAVAATLDHPNYAAAPAGGTLTITKATAGFTFSDTSAVYDGTPKPVGVSTVPAGLATLSISYAGAPTPPTDAGSYAVTVSLDHPNYGGTASTTLEIAQAPAMLSLSNLTQPYDGSPRPVTVTTSPAGLSGVSVTYAGSPAAPTEAGSYAVVASLSNPNYTAADATGTLVIVGQSQTISFAPLADRTYGDPAFAVAATASSGLPVSFSAAGSCSVAGSTVTITGAGVCSITASQAGNGGYAPAADVTQTFSIARASQAITFPALSNRAYSPAPITLQATASSALAVSYSTVGSCAVAGDQLTMTGVGTCSVTAAQAGDANYSPAAGVTRSFTISRASQAITFPALSNRAYSPTPFAISATASSGLPVSLSASGPCTVAGSQVTMTGVGRCSITAAQAGDANYSPAASVTRRFTITRASQTISFAALPGRTYGDPAFAVAATASSGLPVSFTASGQCAVVSGTVTITGAGTCSITARQAGNATYSAAPSVRRTFTIAKAAATVTIGNLSQTYSGAARRVSVTTSPSGLSVRVTYNGSTRAPTSAGSYAVVATTSSANYQGSASATLVIARLDQTIAFAALADRAYSTRAFKLSATASSGLAVSYSATGSCTVSGRTVTMTGTGTCSITAAQPGNSNYNAAPSVTRSFTISPASQAITFPAITNRAYSPTPFTINPRSNSGLPVSLSASGPCTVAGNQVTMTGAGRCSITAAQAGNANYSPAASVTRSFTIR